jgi:hypothetical protein
VSYSIGYYDSAEADGKYHKLGVKCARHGVRILAKKGYYAYPVSAEGAASAFEAAGSSPFDASEIGVQATLSPAQKTPQSVHLRIRVEGGDLMMTKKDDESESRLAIAFASYDADGRRAMSPLGSIQFHLTRDQLATALHKGMTLDRDLPAPDNVQKIRCMVYDRNSGSIGSVTVPIAAADRSGAQ